MPRCFEAAFDLDMRLLSSSCPTGHRWVSKKRPLRALLARSVSIGTPLDWRVCSKFSNQLRSMHLPRSHKFSEVVSGFLQATASNI